jgi:hypothetical protein
MLVVVDHVATNILVPLSDTDGFRLDTVDKQHLMASKRDEGK